MKRDWTIPELQEYWTLQPGELNLLTSKNDENRLGLALLLKFFQIEGRFPEIHFGQNGKIPSNNIEDQELSMLCMHLLQVSLIYVNTLMLQEVLTEPAWSERMTPEDWRGLNPLGYAHVTYGNFTCNMNKRIKLKAKAA